MKFKAKIIIAVRKNLFIKEPAAIRRFNTYDLRRRYIQATLGGRQFACAGYGWVFVEQVQFLQYVQKKKIPRPAY